MAKIRKGDTVEVMTGREKGKRGKVLRVIIPTARPPARGACTRVIVEGVQMVKRHARPTQQNPKGGIVEREAAVSLSNVMVVDPKADKPTRIGFRFLDDGEDGKKKVRFARRSGEAIA